MSLHFSNKSIFTPWRIRWIDAGDIEILDCNNNPVGYRAPAVYRNYAERIVDCVNACADIPQDPQQAAEQERQHNLEAIAAKGQQKGNA